MTHFETTKSDSAPNRRSAAADKGSPLRSYLSNVLSSATARTTAKVYIGDLVSKSLMIASAWMLIRALSVEQYAWYVAFVSVAILFSNLLGNSVNVVLVRFSAEIYAVTGRRPLTLYHRVLKLEMIAYIAFVVICAGFSRRIAQVLLGDASLGYPVMLGAVYGLSMLVLNAGRSFYQAEERFNFYILSMWIRQLAVLLILAAAWMVGRLDFWSAALAFIGVDFLVGGSILAATLRRGRRSSVSYESPGMPEFLKASGWLVGYFLVLAAFERMDVILLSHLSSSESLAIYGVAFRYYSIAMLSLASISAVLRPKFSKPEMQARDRQVMFLNRWLKYTMWLIVPIVLFDLIGEPFFVWLNGDRYGTAFPVWVVLSIGIWIGVVCSPLVNILISRKHFKTLFALGCVALAINLALNLSLIPSMQEMGAAVATVSSYSFVNLCVFLIVCRRKAV
jgi:O-antigen/teichoic acid export membrane protein